MLERQDPTQSEDWDELEEDERARRWTEFNNKFAQDLQKQAMDQAEYTTALKTYYEQLPRLSTGTPAVKEELTLDDDVVILAHIKHPKGLTAVADIAGVHEGTEWGAEERRILDPSIQYFNTRMGKVEDSTGMQKRIVLFNWMVKTVKDGPANQFIVAVPTPGYVAWVYEKIKAWASKDSVVALTTRFSMFRKEQRTFTCLSTLLLQIERQAEDLNRRARHLDNPMSIGESEIRGLIVQAAVQQYGKIASDVTLRIEERNPNFSARQLIEKLDERNARVEDLQASLKHGKGTLYTPKKSHGIYTTELTNNYHSKSPPQADTANRSRSGIGAPPKHCWAFAKGEPCLSNPCRFQHISVDGAGTLSRTEQIPTKSSGSKGKGGGGSTHGNRPASGPPTSKVSGDGRKTGAPGRGFQPGSRGRGGKGTHSGRGVGSALHVSYELDQDQVCWGGWAGDHERKHCGNMIDLAIPKSVEDVPFPQLSLQAAEVLPQLSLQPNVLNLEHRPQACRQDEDKILDEGGAGSEIAQTPTAKPANLRDAQVQEARLYRAKRGYHMSTGGNRPRQRLGYSIPEGDQELPLPTNFYKYPKSDVASGNTSGTYSEPADDAQLETVYGKLRKQVDSKSPRAGVYHMDILYSDTPPELVHSTDEDQDSDSEEHDLPRGLPRSHEGLCLDEPPTRTSSRN
jgi:hypothetical protein